MKIMKTDFLVFCVAFLPKALPSTLLVLEFLQDMHSEGKRVPNVHDPNHKPFIGEYKCTI